MKDLFLSSFIIVFCVISLFASVNPTPLLPHKDENDEREFQNVYQNMAKGPAVYMGNTPNSIPQKIGDLFVSTTTGSVYLSSGTKNSGQWIKIH